MKGRKRLPGILFAACLACLTCLAGAQTVPAGSYTYTITLSAGGKGSFSSEKLLSASVKGGTFNFKSPDTIEITGIAYTNQISSLTEEYKRIDLTQFKEAVVLSDEKYYVKGFHISGREDIEELSIPRTQDAVYVVAYGIKGDQVSYTVNYRDAAGNDLLPSQTFYGNVGDKPVVAFQYIDGYQPQAYNLTKTLSENESENVFTFEYTSTAASAQTEGGSAATSEAASDITAAGTLEGGGTGQDNASRTAAETGQTATTGTAAGGGTTGAATAPAANTFTTGGGGNANAGAGADAGNAAGAEAGEAEAGQENIPEEAVPAELTDLDDEDVPLANTKLDSDGDGQADVAGVADAVLPLRNLPLPLRVFLTALVVGVVGIGLWYILMRRKRRKAAVAEGAESVIENVGEGGSGDTGGGGQ